MLSEFFRNLGFGSKVIRQDKTLGGLYFISTIYVKNTDGHETVVINSESEIIETVEATTEKLALKNHIRLLNQYNKKGKK